MKFLRRIRHTRGAVKRFALGWAAAGAAVLMGAGSAQAALIYNFSDGLQGWTQLNPTGKAAWNGGQIYGHVSDDGSTETYWVRSPEFFVNAAGPLIVSLFGGGSGGALVTNVVDVPASAIGESGFMGVGLRDVVAGTYVASIPSTGSSLDMSAYVNNGRRYTLDYLDYKSGGWGWCGMDNVAIPGTPEQPGTGKDILSFSVLGIPGTISGDTITQHVPFGTDPATLQPVVTVSDRATVVPPNGATVDFSGANNPVTYTVTASNSTAEIPNQRAYAVTVTVLPAWPVTINLAYAKSMNGTYSWQQKGSAATQVAPLAYTGSTWNDCGGGWAAVGDLKDSVGTSTGISVSQALRPHNTPGFSGMGGNKLVSAGLGFGAWSIGDGAIMGQFQDVLTFSGMDMSHSYDIAFALPPGMGGRSAIYKYGTQEAPAPCTELPDWVLAQNYALLTNCFPSETGEITIQMNCNGIDWSAFCGVQLLDKYVKGPPGGTLIMIR
ncbi:MAG: hypothetical protein WCK89_01115 [bacterium]